MHILHPQLRRLLAMLKPRQPRMHNPHFIHILPHRIVLIIGRDQFHQIILQEVLPEFYLGRVHGQLADGLGDGAGVVGVTGGEGDGRDIEGKEFFVDRVENVGEHEHDDGFDGVQDCGILGGEVEEGL